LSGFDGPGSTNGDASLASAFFERDVEISAAALIVVFSIVEGVGRRLDHPPFRLHDSEQVSTVAVGRLIGEVAVVVSLSAR
jgi:hypothetical protein